MPIKDYRHLVDWLKKMAQGTWRKAQGKKMKGPRSLIKLINLINSINLINYYLW